MSTLSRLAAAGLACALMTACAGPQHPNPRDPWEGFNRGVYKFNDTLDHLVFKPVAVAYDTVVPDPVELCVHNIFSNLGDIWGGFNLLLQDRGLDAINMWGRFMVNTTLGVGGCMDIATKTGDPEIDTDFGTTLGVWGIGQGPYLVLPILGPSTVRDGTGTAVDYLANPLGVRDIRNVGLRNSLYGLQFVDTRAGLLDVTNTIDRTALDPYSFTRDAYLQHRAAMMRSTKTNDSDALPKYEDDNDTPAPKEAAPASATPAK